MIICVADSDRDKGLRYKLFTQESSITIQNGIDVTQFGNGINVLKKKKELNIDPEAHVIGIVARLHLQKGYRIFFSAINKYTRSSVAWDVSFITQGREI